MLLNTLLVSASEAAFFGKLITISIWSSAAVAVLAFIIGAKKGIRRVGWYGMGWACAGILFLLIKNMTGGKSATTTAEFVPDLLIAVGCVLLGVFICRFFAWILRPRTKYVKKKGDRYEKDENGIEYDPEKEDYDDYEKYASSKMAVKIGQGKPSIFARLLGGLVCAINVLVVLFVALGLVFYVYGIVYLHTETTGIYSYSLDFAVIGIIFKTAQSGYEKGFIESLRVLFVKLGRWAAAVISFWIPFSKMATASGMTFFYDLTTRCMAAAETIGVPAYSAPFTGRLICGGLLCCVLLFVIWILNKGLIKLADTVDGVSFFRVTDGMLSSIVYALIGCVTAACVMLGMYLCIYFDILAFHTYVEGCYLSNGFFAFCEESIAPVLKTWITTFKGFIGGFIK
jgi:hypothetical protein